MYSEENIRLIFGLKLRQLRQEVGLSPKELVSKSGLSLSYLNEIEKGKKYPKAEKIGALAEALGVDYDELVSLKVSKSLTPIINFLNSNLLKELPLEMFGLNRESLLPLISNAPKKLSAFISTVMEMARNYELRVEQFYLTSLRSYQEMHDNYFPEVEDLVETFFKEHQIDINEEFTVDLLKNILIEKYKYQVDDKLISERPELQGIRSLYHVNKASQKRLLLNDNLNTVQKLFQIGKELGYSFLKIKERGHMPVSVKVNSFEEVLSNFKASYFSGAFLINRQKLIDDLNGIFKQKKWDGDQFLEIMHHYQVSPETFIHRMTNLLSEFFGLNQVFFLRFTNTKGSKQYHITKELHLSSLQDPHGNAIHEHYCRRWITINILKELDSIQENSKEDGPIVRVQRSLYIESGKEYFCISLARGMYPTPATNSSVTLGFLMNRTFKNKIQFWNDPEIPVRLVNETCQRCPLTDCEERVAPQTVLDKEDKIERMESIVEEIYLGFDE